MDFKGKGETIKEKIISIRREIHRFPELSGEEVRTSQLIQQYLKEWDIKYFSGFARTGVLGVINPDSDGPTIALRADMDALPITEKSDHQYVSAVSDKMHACGHDAHTAMLLGTGKLLKSVEQHLPGRVLLVFQPAEENLPIGGARPMMDDGVFDPYYPDAIYGIHVWPDLPVGKVGIRSGVMMSSSDKFIINIFGKGGHGSMPHQTIDAIIIANKVIDILQTIVSRNIDPMEFAVISVGKIAGGYRHNVIADEVLIEGTIRTLNDETKQLVKRRFFEIVEEVTHVMGGTVNIEYVDGYAATVNTEEETTLLRQTAQKLLGKDATPKIKPGSGSEDFARFLEKIPGAFFWVGVRDPLNDNPAPLHDCRFDIDENSLQIGVELMAQLAFDFLTQKSIKNSG